MQRIWSNRSAHAGTGPCVPVPPGEVYFNSVAAMPTHADYYDRWGVVHLLPALDAKVGMPVSAQISFCGGPIAPNPLTAVAFERDDVSGLSVEGPTEVMGAPGETVRARGDVRGDKDRPGATGDTLDRRGSHRRAFLGRGHQPKLSGRER